MNIDERIETLKAVLACLGQALGPDVEFALYDLRKPGICALINGTVSGRSVGFQPDPAVLAAMDQTIMQKGQSVGVLRSAQNGKKIRGSHFLLRTEEGIPYARLCVNQDVTKISQLRDTLDALIAAPAEEQAPLTLDENIIQKTCHAVIMEEIQAHMPVALQSREVKAEIITSLYKKGVFDIKDSVGQVCNLLGISQTTLYNFLREIRRTDVKKDTLF